MMTMMSSRSNRSRSSKSKTATFSAGFCCCCWLLLATTNHLVTMTLAQNQTQLQLATEVWVEKLQSGFGVVTDIQTSSRGDDRLFIMSRNGIIRFLERPPYDESTNVYEFLDIRERVRDNGEQGLLGLAFHPNYDTNGYLFVNYIKNGANQNDRSTIISRFTVSDEDENKANPDSELIIAVIPQPYSNHNGGQIVFGPNDGYLYVGTGDGGSGGDPLNYGQNINELLGKMLRVDVNDISNDDNDNTIQQLPRWKIPPDNPYLGSSSTSSNNADTHTAIWSFGLRNPWRFSFDRANGDLWIADVGQNKREKVTVQLNTSLGNENYGWRMCEGTSVYNRLELLAHGCISCSDPICDDGSTLLQVPVLEYDHKLGSSITGGYVYRGLMYASELGGTYFYADYSSNRLWGARWDTEQGMYRNVIETSGPKNPTTFGQDSNGELYIGNEFGELFQIKPGGGGSSSSVPSSSSSSPVAAIIVIVTTTTLAVLIASISSNNLSF